jgi:hypothetical protein
MLMMMMMLMLMLMLPGIGSGGGFNCRHPPDVPSAAKTPARSTQHDHHQTT